MAVWSKINYSAIIDSNRIDADYYKPEYLFIQNLLNRYYPLVHYISQLIHPSEFKRIYSSNGTTVIRAQNVRPLAIELDNNEVFIQNGLAKLLTKNKVLYGDILITRTGANFGQTSLYTDERENAIVTSHTLILRLNNGISSSYVALFLNTTYGRKMLDRGMYGSSQPEIAPKLIKKIPIPRFKEEVEIKLGDKVTRAYQLKKKSISLYKKATQLLEEALGLDRIEFKREKCYTASFSEVINKNRIDGEHYQPKYKQIKKLILNYKYGWESFLQNVKYITPNFDPKKSPNTPFNYIELSDVNPTLGTIGDIQPILGKDAPSRAKRLVSEGDVIASSVVGSVDKAALITSNENGFLASTGFFHFRSSYYSPEFLLLLVKSILFKEQLFQESTGGILSAVPDQNLKHIIIPCLSNELKNEITELVKRSHQYHKQSKQLLEQAKQEVETLIEQAAKKNE